MHCLPTKRNSTSRTSLACAAMLRMLLIWVASSAALYAQSTTSQRTDKTAPATCPVTLPRKAPLAPSEAAKLFGAGSAHWHGALFENSSHDFLHAVEDLPALILFISVKQCQNPQRPTYS